MPAEAVRAFVALPCPPGLCQAIAAAVAVWREMSAAVRWTVPDRTHLTLRFLGQAEADRLARLDPALRRAAAEVGPLELETSGTGAFPGWERPRVLWLRVTTGPALARLVAAVDIGARSAGFEPEERELTPHLTLGRVRDARGARRATQAVRGWKPETGRETVTEMILYLSDLDGGPGRGPLHSALARYPLAGDRPS